MNRRARVENEVEALFKERLEQQCYAERVSDRDLSPLLQPVKELVCYFATPFAFPDQEPVPVLAKSASRLQEHCADFGEALPILAVHMRKYFTIFAYCTYAGSVAFTIHPYGRKDVYDLHCPIYLASSA